MERCLDDALIPDANRFEIVLFPLFVPIFALHIFDLVVEPDSFQRERVYFGLQVRFGESPFRNECLQPVFIFGETFKSYFAQFGGQYVADDAWF